MHVGILTFHTADNYGAVLQAAALTRAVTAMGHNAEVIDYRPSSATKHYRRWGLRSGTFFQTLRMRHHFRRFRRESLSRSQQKSLKLHDLNKQAAHYDAIITGSDQVWNTESYRGFDPSFFLGFGYNQQFRKISYAASVGGAKNFNAPAAEVQLLLKQLDHISVRDYRSFHAVRQATGIEPKIVLDPVFLADMSDLAKPPLGFKQGAVVGYCLKDVDHFSKILVSTSQTLQEPFFALGNNPGANGTWLGGAGPTEWLGCFKHAGCIVTNSFHGLCFALIFRKPFIIPSHNGSSQQRLTDLLSSLGLEDRLVNDHLDAASAVKQWSNIDLDLVYGKLSELSDQSFAFLRGALS